MPQSSHLEQIVFDPTLSTFEFPLRGAYYPLGFPLTLETNSEDVIKAANEGWRHFSQTFDTPPVRIALGVTESDTIPLNLQSTFRSREHLMSVIADLENFYTCDFDRGYTFGWVTRAVASDHPLLRYRFLTGAANMMLEQLVLAPLHGALVVRNGCGVLLFGESFAGKSTLAYACARAGWTYVSDDASFLVRSRADNYAVGEAHSIRFRDDARAFFPELADHLPVVRPNGKIGLELFTSELPIATAAGSCIHHVVFLNRREDAYMRLRCYPKDQALEAWQSHANFGTRSVRAAQTRCYERLLCARISELTYSHFQEAVICLERFVDSGE